jgi:ubiquinone/menaquinone biosynthesis C-methylase UbiE
MNSPKDADRSSPQRRSLATPVARTVRLARRIAEGVAWRLNKLERGTALDEHSAHNQTVVGCMNQYNMVTEPDEPYYAQQYLRVILPELERRFPHRRTAILDLGCGQGRLSLPLASWSAESGGTVTGVDLTPAAVAQAQQYAAAQHLQNLTFVCRDAAKFAPEAPSASADAVVFTEVTFFMPAYREVLRELRRILKPGGVAFIAFRSQYYNLLQLASIRYWENAKRCLTEREGNIFGGDTLHVWQTTEDVHQLMDEFGLRTLRLFGIGVLSGVKGDARGAIIHPAQLAPKDQEDLMELECASAERYAACGRYILAVAERPTNA